MPLKAENFAQTSSLFRSHSTVVRVISYIQLITGLVVPVSVVTCYILSVIDNSLEIYIDVYCVLFVSALPDSSLLIGFCLYLLRLRSIKYKDELKIYVRLYGRLCLLSVLYSVVLMVIGGLYLKKGIKESGETTREHSATVIVLVAALVQFFTTLPLSGIALQAQQHIP